MLALSHYFAWHLPDDSPLHAKPHIETWDKHCAAVPPTDTGTLLEADFFSTLPGDIFTASAGSVKQLVSVLQRAEQEPNPPKGLPTVEVRNAWMGLATRLRLPSFGGPPRCISSFFTPLVPASEQASVQATESAAGVGDKRTSSEPQQQTKAELAELELTTPAFERGSGMWIRAKFAATLEGLETRTLAQYRTDGITNADGTIGKDRDGRVWRRPGTCSSHPWYLQPTLKKIQEQEAINRR